VKAAASALLLAACGSRPPVPGPDATLLAYAQAAERGDADAAWEILSPAEKQRTSREDLRRAFRENRAELEDQARTLRRALAAPVRASAEVPTADGGRAIVALEKGSWRIAGGVTGAESLRTPRDTMAVLRSALQRRSYDAVLRVLSRSARAQVEDEVRRLLFALEDIDALSIEVDGDHARIELDPGHAVELQHEDGEWRIVEVE